MKQQPLSATQLLVYARLTDQPQSAYQLKASLATLRALVKKSAAKDVTPPGIGGMFFPRNHFMYVRVPR